MVQGRCSVMLYSKRWLKNWSFLAGANPVACQCTDMRESLSLS
jgi:hypothetical protein